jgi:hypothetical protein
MPIVQKPAGVADSHSGGMKVLATTPIGAHPLWHLAIVAGAAVAVFAGIKVSEYRATRRESSATGSRSLSHLMSRRTPWPAPNDLYLAAALCSAGAAAIHAAVCPRHFREAFLFGVFFLVASAAQAAWSVLLWYRASRRLLLVGAIGNAATIVVWAVSRTTGLPVGPDKWHPEAISPADVVATVLEVVIVIAAATLLRHIPTPAGQSRERQHARV